MEKKWETVTAGPVSGASFEGIVREHTAMMAFSEGTLFRTIVVTDSGVSVSTTWTPVIPPKS
jgi:hypothetical protein